MAIAFRSATSTQTSSGSTLAATKPSGTASGDVLVAICWQDSDGSGGIANLTAPAGWTQTGSNITSTSTSPIGKVFYKVAGGSEGSSYSFGLASGSSAVIFVLAFSGANTASPIAVAATAGTGTGTSQGAPSISGTSGDELICSWAAQSGSLSWSAASGMTERGDLTSSWVGAAVDTLDLASTAATGTKTATSSGSPSGNWRSVTLSISGTIAKSGSATATLTLAASSTAVSARSGARTATMRLDTSATTSAAKNVAPAAATLILAATAGGSPAKNVSVDADPLILTASSEGHQINLGLAVLTLSASMASPLHAGGAARTAPAVLQATVAGTQRATTIGPINALLLLTTSADTVSDHFGGPVDAAPLFLTAAANAERIITEVTQAIQSRASLSVQYELVCMARIPQTTGPPLLLAVDPIDWTGLSYTDELSKPQQLQAGCQISGLTDAVVQRLRNLDELATELWLYRLGKLVFAGPLLGWQVQGEALTFNASGLLAYLKSMVIQQDLVFSQVDQFTMAYTMVDQWQNLDYGNFGIDTTNPSASGVLRDGTYLQKELHNVHQRVTELGARQNGFDVSVDPASRRFTLDYPIKGVDRSSGEDAIVFDDRNVTSPNIVASAAPGDVASEGYGTGTNSAAGGDTIFSVASNLELRARYGRTAVTATFDGVSEQATLDAYTQGLIDARGNVLLVPGPDVRVTPDSDLGSYDVGDTVSYQLHSRLSVAGAFRIRKRQVTVSKTGQESTSIQFV